MFVYFSSDRGTAMNLWRLRSTSRAARSEALPSRDGRRSGGRGRPSFSKNGSRLAFKSRVGSVNPVAIPLDPVSLRAGIPVLLDTRNNIRVPSGVSPDGKQIAFYSIGEAQEDLFIAPVDGPIRRVTTTRRAIASRCLRLMAGRSVLFEPGRPMGAVDHRHRRRRPPQDCQAKGRRCVRPDVTPGDAVVFSSGSAQEMYTAPIASAVSTPTLLPGSRTNGKFIGPTDWSSDGTRLAGTLVARERGLCGRWHLRLPDPQDDRAVQ
jgi:hypothetical protein